MFTAAQLIIVPNWKQSKCLKMHCKNKLENTHTMEYRKAMKMNKKNYTHDMDKSHKHGERSQTQKSIYSLSALYKVESQAKLIYGIRTQVRGYPGGGSD